MDRCGILRADSREPTSEPLLPRRSERRVGCSLEGGRSVFGDQRTRSYDCLLTSFQLMAGAPPSARQGSEVKNGLRDKDWDTLLKRIARGKCTPFVGAGACIGTLPLGSEIARRWAKSNKYPLADADNLPAVAQFLAVDRDPAYPKDEIVRLFEGVEPPPFDRDDEPHGVLAELPLPVYITTNYDDFMVQALKKRDKDPKREICRWNVLVRDEPSIFESQPGFQPTTANPVVFHLHGHSGITESLVLTEDDYLDFLVNLSKDSDLLEPRIQRALTGTSLLFIGYSLADWDFKVIFRGLVKGMEGSLRRMSVSVQLLPPATEEDAPPEAQEEKQERVRSYLDQYFGGMDVRVYWGTAREFAAELRRRWRLKKPTLEA